MSIVKCFINILFLLLIYILSFSIVDAEYKVSAWLVPWDNQSGIDSITRNKDYIDVISPFWYHVNEDGTVTAVKDAEDAAIIKFAKDNKIPIIPTISNSFDGEKIHGFLTISEEKKKNIQNIVDLITKKTYDGIDIDYEGIKSADMDAFTAYIKDLRTELNKIKKKLTIAVQAKTFETLELYGNRGQDWPKIYPYVDEFRIMVYDYGWRGSIPRPVAPTYWAEDVLKYAVATVPREKVYLGVPFYGYGWSEDFFSSYTYDTILFILEKYGVDFQYSPEEKTNRLFYVSDQDDRDPKVPHQIWFENHTSLEPKLELVKKYNIAGISIWRLGKEDNENWRRIRRILKNEVLPTTTFFQDVDAKTKYFTEIARLADLGIVKGMGGTNLFKPLTKINRAEVLKMALNSFARDISKYSFIETLPENFINPFKDIVQGSWFTHYVLTAVEMNIVKGYPDGTFKPEKNVTRAEALKLALESAEIKVPATTYSSLWYMPYKNWAVNHKLYTALNFLPHEEITRAEAAYIIAKVIAEVEK